MILLIHCFFSYKLEYLVSHYDCICITRYKLTLSALLEICLTLYTRSLAVFKIVQRA